MAVLACAQARALVRETTGGPSAPHYARPSLRGSSSLPRRDGLLLGLVGRRDDVLGGHDRRAVHLRAAHHDHEAAAEGRRAPVLAPPGALSGPSLGLSSRQMASNRNQRQFDEHLPSDGQTDADPSTSRTDCAHCSVLSGALSAGPSAMSAIAIAIAGPATRSPGWEVSIFPTISLHLRSGLSTGSWWKSVSRFCIVVVISVKATSLPFSCCWTTQTQISLRSALASSGPFASTKRTPPLSSNVSSSSKLPPVPLPHHPIR